MENQVEIESRWSTQWEDGVNEIVFIGQNLNEAEMIQELNSCLLSDSEILDFKQNRLFQNPFESLL
ncbi:GTP-binding protein [Mucilaginibacter sp. 21P]|nr:GTP-binding protein [Mucilaginibacter sp. 21P]